MTRVILPRTLHLASPLMTGPDVARAQRLLHANIFKQDFLHGGTIDGQFGPDTSGAAARAHYWVGDATSQRVMGQRLSDFLTGTMKLDADNATRRKHRLELAQHRADSKTVGRKMIESAAMFIGTKESPSGSNVVMFNEWYYGISHAQAMRQWSPSHPGPPWCAAFVCYNGVKAGSKAFSTQDFCLAMQWAYVPFIVNSARAGQHFLSITHSPVLGDLVCYDWPGESKGVADHIGFFQEWRDKSKGTFIAVEGNTAYGNNSNGGEVMRRGEGSDYRTLSEVQAFVHVAA